MADLKIGWLVNSGLMPCIFGCWGFYSRLAGKDVLKKHWDYLLARYGAYPVVWCMAGEATMPFYNDKYSDEEIESLRSNAKSEWTEITRYVRDKDPFKRVITIHSQRYGHDMLEDETLMDLNMLQTGHGSYNSLSNTVSMIRETIKREPKHPVINGEVCYEGICSSNYQDIQRFAFWACILSGACGHTYGANGIWQLNTIEKPYGPSPHGMSWGNTPWEEAYRPPGSKQSGLAKKFLERYNWWEFEMHPEWMENHSNEENKYIAPFAAGIPGKVRVMFLPLLGGFVWGHIAVKEFEKNTSYRVFYFDPVSGNELGKGILKSDENGFIFVEKPNLLQDWILVFENIKRSEKNE
jgi:hypothetical protein